MDTIGSLFGMGKSMSAPGPDKATLSAQQREERRLQEEEARQAREAGSRQRIINATVGRGGPVTLFKRAGPSRTSALGG